MNESKTKKPIERRQTGAAALTDHVRLIDPAVCLIAPDVARGEIHQRIRRQGERLRGYFCLFTT